MNDEEMDIIWHRIFKSLPYQIILNCRAVCKYWNRIICEWTYFQENTVFVISNPGNGFFQTNENTLQHVPEFIQSMQLKYFHNFNTSANPALRFLSSNVLHQITTLHFYKCVIQQQNLMTSIFQMNSLLELRLMRCQIQFGGNIEPEAGKTPDYIQCTILQQLHLLMTITDICYLTKTLLPHLNRLITLKIEEILEMSLTGDLKLNKDEDFYEFGATDERVQTLTTLPYDQAANALEDDVSLNSSRMRYEYGPDDLTLEYDWDGIHWIPDHPPDTWLPNQPQALIGEFWITDNQLDDATQQKHHPATSLSPIPFMPEFLNLIQQNKFSLKHLGISLTSTSLYSAAAQLMQNTLQALSSAEIQLTSLTLNGINKPLHVLPQNEFDASFQNSLSTFLNLQTNLKELVLGLHGIDKNIQTHIQNSLPETLEKLKILPASHQQDLTHLPKLVELELPKDIRRQVDIEGADPNGLWWERWTYVSTNFGIFQEPPKVYQKLKSFKGELYFTPEQNILFCKSVPFLTKLDVLLNNSAGTFKFGYPDPLQTIIEQLEHLVELGLEYCSFPNLVAAITGFPDEFIKDVTEMNNYPRILPSLNVVKFGWALSDLKFLEKLTIHGLHVTDFGIYFGLASTKLKFLDIRRNWRPYSNMHYQIISEWGLVQLASGLKAHLQELHLNVAGNISIAALKNFVSQLPLLNRKSIITHESLELTCNKRLKIPQTGHYYSNTMA